MTDHEIIGFDLAHGEDKTVTCIRQGAKIIGEVPNDARLINFKGQCVIAVPSTGEAFIATDKGLERVEIEGFYDTVGGL